MKLLPAITPEKIEFLADKVKELIK